MHNTGHQALPESSSTDSNHWHIKGNESITHSAQRQLLETIKWKWSQINWSKQLWKQTNNAYILHSYRAYTYICWLLFPGTMERLLNVVETLRHIKFDPERVSWPHIINININICWCGCQHNLLLFLAAASFSMFYWCAINDKVTESQTWNAVKENEPLPKGA